MTFRRESDESELERGLASAQSGSVTGGIGRTDGVNGRGRIYELRSYVTEPGRMDVLLDRFRHHTPGRCAPALPPDPTR